MVLPARSATLAISSPVVTIYSTPSVLMAATSTPPASFILLYSTLARLQGTRATSTSPFTSSGGYLVRRAVHRHLIVVARLALVHAVHQAHKAHGGGALQAGDAKGCALGRLLRLAFAGGALRRSRRRPAGRGAAAPARSAAHKASASKRLIIFFINRFLFSARPRARLCIDSSTIL